MDNESANKIAAAVLAGNLMQNNGQTQSADRYIEVFHEILKNILHIDEVENKHSRGDYFKNRNMPGEE